MMRHRVFAIAAGIMLALPAGAAAGTPPANDPFFPPPSETLPPALQAAKQELIDIVARRDMKALLSHVDPTTKLSFGGDRGPDDLLWMWSENDETRQELWRVLETILALPGEARGSAEQPEYCTPYVFCAVMPGDIDPFEAVAVTGTEVAIRDQPSLDGKVLDRVSHVVLSWADDTDDGYENPPGWARVQRASGLRGYISSDWVRSPIDFRLSLLLDPKTGTWRLGYFIAGD